MDKQLKSVKHNYIRYANCWEDADILLDGLNPEPGAKILSIGSAGDNSFAFLANNPGIVVAVDINPVQLKLIELKKAAFITFDYNNFSEFLGFKESKNRKELFKSLTPNLKKSDIDFWNEHFHFIEEGLIYSGKFERYFNAFAYKVLPLIHTKKRINTLFKKKTESKQKYYFNQKWNNLRWRLLFKIFFSKFVLSRFGRSKGFVKEVDINVGDFIFKKASKHLSSTYCQNNYFLKYILTGKFEKNLPFYARKENYEKIKSNIHKFEIVEGLLENTFNKDTSFTHLNLSDIFEYMNPQIFKEISENIVNNTKPGTKIAYWNLMVPRILSDENNKAFKYDEELSKKLSEEDKGFFYNKFIIDERI